MPEPERTALKYLCAFNRFIQLTHYTRRSSEFFKLSRDAHGKLLRRVVHAKTKILDVLFRTNCYKSKKGKWRCDGWNKRSCAYQG
eukprot:SAG25_NODE_6206_length_579_cov_0.654167_1_plen_85_part_00